MKKIVNILIIILILASAMRLTIDRHFCGGKVVDIRVESGSRRASCGMESCETKSLDLSYMLSQPGCCHNEVVAYSVDNYLVTGSSEVKMSFTPVNNFLSETPVYRLTSNERVALFLSGAGPPGPGIKQPDQQSRLRVFRI